MNKIPGDKFLRHFFSEQELKTLFENEEFMEFRQKVETIEDFEKLCFLGSEVLSRGEKIVPALFSPFTREEEQPVSRY